MKITLGIALATILAVTVAYSDDVAELRAGGQASVDALHRELMAKPAADRANVEALLDRVCAQKDCRTSRLYWYTDLEEAKRAAQRLRRPILALHLLGRLDEELSCANSRFFRTLLYSDPSIANVLRDDYVLYWHSVRPVPRVTIEMGDGRVIRQTITGNSVHYLLSEDGAVLDALPGLYSPKAFREQLERWAAFHRSFDGDPATLRAYHQAQTTIQLVAADLSAAPTAENAARLAATKSIVERPLLRQLTPVTSVRIEPLQPWVEIGEREMNDVVFSPESLALIREKQPEAGNDALRRAVAIDNAFNERDLHPRIHWWFANGEVRDLDSLNERVYRELFLTPSEDPWLGLRQPSVFAALGD